VIATSAAPRTININGMPAASGVPMPFTLANGDNTITVEVDGPFGPRSYHVVVTRGGVLDDLVSKPPTTGLGVAIAMSGDTLAVGDAAALLFIFHRAADGTWSQEAMFTGPRASWFAHWLALDATGETLFVTENPTSDVMMVGIYTRANGTWTRAGTIPNPDGYNTAFGEPIVLSGDTLAIGAPAESSDTSGVNPAHNMGATSSGAVYVYRGAGTSWSLEAFIKASNPDAQDQFGEVLALDGDTLAVGAGYEDSSSTGINSTPNNSTNEAGAVYVFGRSGTTWSQQAYIKPSRPLAANSNFGWRLALSGNVLAAGLYSDGSSLGGLNPSSYDQNAANSGAVYLFARSGANWSQAAFLKAAQPHAGDLFGNALALDGNRLAVSAPGWSGDTGAVFLFDRSGVAWSDPASIVAPGSDTVHGFGNGLAISGDTLLVVDGNILSPDPASIYVY